jgi:hypothetical protein
MRVFLVGMTLFLGSYGLGSWLLTASGHPLGVAGALWDCGLLLLGAGVGWGLRRLELMRETLQRSDQCGKESSSPLPRR